MHGRLFAQVLARAASRYAVFVGGVFSHPACNVVARCDPSYSLGVAVPRTGGGGPAFFTWWCGGQPPQRLDALCFGVRAQPLFVGATERFDV